ncbi:NUDIX domain-containing protein [Palleronia sp. LCG004]|uniref:NUDIX domain-containing protein n=1 Tax=Palleronia sp. LCG004 TaxID=3079304 RepID=UPI002941E1DA|nr:NUDIX domain-containing protein [Palleronia sp. LCG004]WOI55085.1 NUDIX domain-containing protein [Palleronia sp. LCG004]
MSGFFIYGPLLDDNLREQVVGAPLAGQPAVLTNHALRLEANGDAILIAQAGATVSGLMLYPNAKQAARLAYYATGCGGSPETCDVRIGTEQREATLFRISGTTGVGPWDFGEWSTRYGKVTRRAADEAMAYLGEIDGTTLRARMPTILMRAAARLRGETHDAPVTLRSATHRDRVEVIAETRPYVDYFAVEEVIVSHPRFDGGKSERLKRAGFVMGDAVTVLPYDPVRETVMLIEQFRAAPFLRGDPRPWVLEPIAGRIDPGETPEEAARREAIEEAGLELRALHLIGGNYPSPGAVTEYLFCHIGIADLPDEAEGLGGLDAEGEDIRAHVIPFDRLMELVETGEIDTGPTMLSALWLERERARGRFA